MKLCIGYIIVFYKEFSVNIDEMINLRRYFHHIAEPARLEFKTTDKIIQELRDLDIELHYGKEIYFDDRLGLPDEKKLVSIRTILI